jgi:hypothetical protein
MICVSGGALRFPPLRYGMLRDRFGLLREGKGRGRKVHPKPGFLWKPGLAFDYPVGGLKKL